MCISGGTTEGDDVSAEEGRLSTPEVARLLGVKVETVYAYASRGLLSSERIPHGKGSTFSATQVHELLRHRQRAPSTGSPVELGRIRTGITLIENGRLFYRGADAVELAGRHGFETVVGRLWELDREAEFRPPPGLAELLARAGEALRVPARRTDRLRLCVPVAASADLLRFDLREENVLAAGAALIGAMVESLPAGSRSGSQSGAASPSGDGRLADRLWIRLCAAPPAPAAVACLDQALVLLADHDLAVSTVAARVAASARAHPYAVVSAGLGALDGPLHGAASGLAHRILAEVLAGDAEVVVSEYRRAGLPIPGLGHPLYPDGDPRARALLTGMRTVPAAGPVLDAVDALVRAAAGHSTAAANIDLALAALALTNGMPAETGEVIFAVARTAGWIAHAVEEYREPPLRMRARGVYTGPRPSPSDVPGSA
jgi:citrate synthase